MPINMHLVVDFTRAVGAQSLRNIKVLMIDYLPLGTSTQGNNRLTVGPKSLLDTSQQRKIVAIELGQGLKDWFRAQNTHSTCTSQFPRVLLPRGN